VGATEWARLGWAGQGGGTYPLGPLAAQAPAAASAAAAAPWGILCPGHCCGAAARRSPRCHPPGGSAGSGAAGRQTRSWCHPTRLPRPQGQHRATQGQHKAPQWNKPTHARACAREGLRAGGGARRCSRRRASRHTSARSRARTPAACERRAAAVPPAAPLLTPASRAPGCGCADAAAALQRPRLNRAGTPGQVRVWGRRQGGRTHTRTTTPRRGCPGTAACRRASGGKTLGRGAPRWCCSGTPVRANNPPPHPSSMGTTRGGDPAAMHPPHTAHACQAPPQQSPPLHSTQPYPHHIPAPPNLSATATTTDPSTTRHPPPPHHTSAHPTPGPPHHSTTTAYPSTAQPPQVTHLGVAVPVVRNGAGGMVVRGREASGVGSAGGSPSGRTSGDGAGNQPGCLKVLQRHRVSAHDVEGAAQEGNGGAGQQVPRPHRRPVGLGNDLLHREGAGRRAGTWKGGGEHEGSRGGGWGEHEGGGRIDVGNTGWAGRGIRAG
jgi:hypothetical protein